MDYNYYNSKICKFFRFQNEILELKKQLSSERKTNKLLQKNLKRLQKENKSAIKSAVHDTLKTVFIPKQIYKFMNPNKKKIKWGIEDITALRSASPKAYRYLKKNNYPLPGLFTLRNWASTLNLSEGILKDILTLMKRKADSLSAQEKVIVLCFDEIYEAFTSTVPARGARASNRAISNSCL